MTPANLDPMERSTPTGPHGPTQGPPPDELRCKALSKRSGQRCRRWAIKGGRVCPAHGGNAPQVRAAAERRMEVAEVEAAVRRSIAFEAIDGLEDPFAALSRLAAQAVATERALAQKVNDLALDDRLRFTDSRGAEQLRAEVALWTQWAREAARLAERLVALNIDERRMRLTEQQGQLIARCIRAILGRLMLSPEQEALVPVVVPQELRRVASTEGEQ